MIAAVAAVGCGGGGGATPGADAPTIVVDATPEVDARPPLAVGMLVASRGSDVVLRFDGSGAAKGVFASSSSLVKPVGVTFGPDGNLYVAAGDTDHVVRFDGATGGAMGTFTHGATIQSPRNLNFGPDGGFYVADGFLDQIIRFDGTTGDFDRIVVNGGDLDGPTSFTFGPDGNLYVVSVLTNAVLRYDGATGAPLGAFVDGGLAQPHDVSFGPDGNLYVTNSQNGLVQRYRGDTGAFIDTFVHDTHLRAPLGMAWGPDGNLYVANQGGNEIRRYDGQTGADLGAFVEAGAGGLTMPAFFVFLPAPALAVTRVEGALAVAGARPGARVLYVRGDAGGSGTLADCPALTLPLGQPVVDQVRMADESGYALAAANATVVVDAARCTMAP
jgi:streptogramin lyase